MNMKREAGPVVGVGLVAAACSSSSNNVTVIAFRSICKGRTSARLGNVVPTVFHIVYGSCGRLISRTE